MPRSSKAVSKKPRKHKIKVLQLPHAQGLPLPAYQSLAAAGFDLIAAVAKSAPTTLKPGARALIPTGLIFELPEGSEGQVRPRSGLAVKYGVTVLNSPGTIDSDYRGEIQVALINLGQTEFRIERGERIAQFILAPIVRAKLRVKQKLKATERGGRGFGSTGVTTVAAALPPPRKKTASAGKKPPPPRRAAKKPAVKKKTSR